jgi:glycyl-tRNA synthetase beta subunit
MKITFTLDTKNKSEVNEALEYLQSLVKPKAKSNTEEAVKRTETVVEEPKEVKPIPNPTPKEKKASSVSEQELLNAAKAAKIRTDHNTVKKTIDEFAPKISEVKESDRAELLKKLEAL